MSVVSDVSIVADGTGARADTVVVVDVVRAFTTAAAALAAGAARVICAPTADDALAMRRTDPGAVLAGEEWGTPPAGFDLGNSPRELSRAGVRGAVVVLLSQNGTRSLAEAREAPTLLAAAAVNLAATAAWIRSRNAASRGVRIVCTDPNGEDRACAEHLAALVAGGAADARATAALVRTAADRHLEVWRRFHPPGACQGFRDDVDECAAVDAYDFAMVGRALGTCVELRAARAGDD